MNKDTESEISEKLTEILERLMRIERRLIEVGSSCQGMDTHISFVESVYTTVRRPLDYVVQTITGLMGERSYSSLPDYQETVNAGNYYALT